MIPQEKSRQEEEARMADQQEKIQAHMKKQIRPPPVPYNLEGHVII